MRLNNILLKNISKALRLSLNEMARRTVTRTIDNKLWLSVASTCSRNRSNDAELIKPLGNDKNILLLKYVAALIIMKKPCPQTPLDMVNNKTFKLVGLKLLELGVTFDEIQNLYDLNTGNTPIKKPVLNPVVKQDNDNVEIPQDPVKKSGGLFDDDIFDDSFTDFSEDIVGLDKATSLEIIYYKLTGKPRPRGWKFIKHTNDTYDKLTCVGDTYCFRYKAKKYIQDVKDMVKEKNWNVYIISPYEGLEYALYSDFYFEDLDDNLTDDKILSKMKEFISSGISYSTNVKTTEEYEERADALAKNYKKYKEYRKKEISYINDTYVLELFKNNNAIYAVYLSPDRGIQIVVSRINNYMYLKRSNEYLWEMTFTGLVNYNKLEGFYFDKDEELNKIRNVKKETALNNQRTKALKNAYRDFIKQKCHWNLKSFDFGVDNETSLPYIFGKFGTQDSFDKDIIWWKNVRSKISKKHSMIAVIPTEPDSVKEYLLNPEIYNNCYLRVIFIKDINNKYATDTDYIILFKLTDEGYSNFKRWSNLY